MFVTVFPKAAAFPGAGGQAADRNAPGVVIGKGVRGARGDLSRSADPW